MRQLSEHEALKEYDGMLDECFGMVKVAGYEYPTSQCLRDTDPTAYRCGFNDWCDAEGIEVE